jgi:hypothetical protein
MRPGEAQLIGDFLADKMGDISTCLNLGSSTLRFRTVTQPHIDRYVFAPLRANQVRVVHADLKRDEGVDIAGDLFDQSTCEQLAAAEPDLLLCCNLLEHVVDPSALAARMASLLKPGGLLLATVPFSYPLHFDPIDTYFRPSPAQLAALFPGFSTVRAEVHTDVTYLRDLLTKRGWLGTVGHFALSPGRMIALSLWPQKWKGHFHRYLWLLRPYKVSVVLLRKGPSA